MYALFILPRVKKELAQIPERDFERIRDAIRALAETPRPPGFLKLSGGEGWRIRVGDLRVIYEIDDKSKTITVQHVGHRRDVYR
jgi:mRNA interferase RelE/StbE